MGDRGRTFDYALGSEGPKWAADLVARCAAAAVADLTELSEELPEWRASRELGRLRTEGLAVDLALSLAEITDERAGSPLWSQESPWMPMRGPQEGLAPLTRYVEAAMQVVVEFVMDAHASGRLEKGGAVREAAELLVVHAL